MIKLNKRIYCFSQDGEVDRQGVMREAERDHAVGGSSKPLQNQLFK